MRNYGWPCYEGAGRMSSYDGADLSLCETLYSQGAGAHNGPYYTYNHGACVVAARELLVDRPNFDLGRRGVRGRHRRGRGLGAELRRSGHASDSMMRRMLAQPLSGPPSVRSATDSMMWSNDAAR